MPQRLPRLQGCSDAASIAGDRAASEVLGSLLLAGMTVTFTVVFGQAMLGAMPEPEPRPSTFEIQVDEGRQGWASGDERIRVHHAGGASLARGEARLLIEIGDEQRTLEGDELAGPFADGELTIGETWTTELTVPAASYVDVSIVRADPSRAVVASTAFHTPHPSCVDDTEPPYVSVWTQDPDPVADDTDGSVTVTATLADACSGVDPNASLDLAYAIEGSDVAGNRSADRVGQRTWQAAIPEPAESWSAHGGHTLTYRFENLTDEADNVGTSANRSTPIEDEADEGELTYITDHVVFSGSVTSFEAAQNASDDGEAAILEEEGTSSGTTRSHAYATAHSSSPGTEDPGDATGSPDDAYARLDADGEEIAVEGFRTFSGDIHAVELAFQATDEGTDGADDELVVSYEVANRRGKTSESYTPEEIGTSTDEDAVFLNVTDDRDWAWTDVDDLQIAAGYDRRGQADDITYTVDALWVRVTYEDPGYNMSIRGDIEGLPAGDHALELRYAISEEPHHVQVWNATAAAWEDRGSTLTSTSLRSWSVDLTDDEVDGNTTRFRIVDDGADPRQRSTVELDHARGRTVP